MTEELKPLDLSNLLKHAFMCGRESQKGTGGTAIEAWVEYDPAENPSFQRVESALKLSAPTRPTPKVKPLVWSGGRGKDGGYFSANAGFGGLEYYLMDYEDASWGWFTSFKAASGYAGKQGREPTLEAAKAAAQADYERRILSALEGV